MIRNGKVYKFYVMPTESRTLADLQQMEQQAIDRRAKQHLTIDEKIRKEMRYAEIGSKQ